MTLTLNGYHHIPITPVPAPRQSRSDTWKPSPQVVRYRAFKDAIRPYLQSLPPTFEVIFVLPMPKSWSAKKRQAMDRTIHQQKPDTDNLIKAFKDAIENEDSFIFHDPPWKFWGEEGGIYWKPLDIPLSITLDDLIG